MFIFLLFAIINLTIGFGAAILLGYGPQPWYALFLPSDRDCRVQIDAIDSKEEETKKPQPIAKPEEPAASPKTAEPEPNIVNQPFPEINEPEDMPIVPQPVAEEKPGVNEEEESVEPVAEQAPTEPSSEIPSESDEDNELEKYLAGHKKEPEENTKADPEVEETSEIASTDDIESMFAASQESEDEEKTSVNATTQEDVEESDELDDKPLDQDDIAALFNS
ncbi:hypothetical protein [Bremerella alba]|uniref:Uncharacterized protein n=1 Tax=Bremerella alba TaxID=980252 RepID=A0A7V8V4N7_9BACT|nr:hypothetical protein [Bremerella alba]MBA2114765.1 hypothetical protein [Bremerella alba]